MAPRKRSSSKRSPASRKKPVPSRAGRDRPRRAGTVVPPEILDVPLPPRNGLAGQSVDIPFDLPILPLRNTVVFPGAVLPLTVGRDRSLAAVSHTLAGKNVIGVVAQKTASAADLSPDDLHAAGTACHILKALTLPDGTQNIIVQGLARFRVLRVTQVEPFLRAEIGIIEETVQPSPSAKRDDAFVLNVKRLAKRAVELSPSVADEVSVIIQNIDKPSALADYVAAHLDLSVAEKQAILETPDARDRLKKLSRFLATNLEVLELCHRIQSEVHGQIEKTQREYFLREQMKAIQRELGAEDKDSAEIEMLQKKIADAKMPEGVEKEALRELDRLRRIPSVSPEHAVTRNYVEWLSDLPWARSTPDTLDIEQARQVLDEDHYDLEKVKRRILEFLAVRKLKSDTKGPILFFCGPPGVGKTSLGRSIARAMGRKFIRISLGGMHDEAEIRGHRRTYVGALPGRIIQELRKAGTNNPVFMLDEVDKIGADFRGDPASALLEVLDPEQNFSFTDHYLDVPFDLSRVMFIATGNVIDPVPPALKDRMEMIEIPGYTEEEKLVIARTYLVPKQTLENGLSADLIEWPDDMLVAVIRRYTREAGLRNLEREIASVSRGVARDVASGKTDKARVDPDRLHALLGPPKFESEVAQRVTVPGVAIGLAWTPTGGDILFIEATRMEGKGKLLLTGQIGEVMKESAQAALSYVRSRASELGIDPGLFEKSDLHIHVPAGAVPKDGPSAGITILAALVSLLTRRLMPHEVAMTGEITLRGKVLPVGGVKEKLLAGLRAGIREIVLPDQNRKDLEDVPKEARDRLSFTFVSTLDDVLSRLFGAPSEA
ncbi:MAG: endopeptidase La [Planctomycetota bacterium]